MLTYFYQCFIQNFSEIVALIISKFKITRFSKILALITIEVDNNETIAEGNSKPHFLKFRQIKITKSKNLTKIKNFANLSKFSNIVITNIKAIRILTF